MQRFKRGKFRDIRDVADDLASVPGIRTEQLSAGDVIEVETANHRYRLTVVEPETGLVDATSDGPHLVAGRLYLRGSLVGRTMLRLRWIAVGFRLELGRLTLTPTRRVTVNGVLVLPKPDASA